MALSKQEEESLRTAAGSIDRIMPYDANDAEFADYLDDFSGAHTYAKYDGPVENVCRVPFFSFRKLFL